MILVFNKKSFFKGTLFIHYSKLHLFCQKSKSHLFCRKKKVNYIYQQLTPCKTHVIFS